MPPPVNVIKVNFDAAIQENGSATAACVVRDYTGKLFLMAGFNCSHLEVEEAE